MESTFVAAWVGGHIVLLTAMILRRVFGQATGV